MAQSEPLSIALICGGPSGERGISLNSARSALDHLQDWAEVRVFYVDPNLGWWRLPPTSLYSNTPADFDFKIAQLAEALPGDAPRAELAQADIVFPLIHGRYGEDGDLFAQLETWRIQYLGTPSEAARRAFDKSVSREVLETAGQPVIPQLRVDPATPLRQARAFVEQAGPAGAVLKPAVSGSSLDVYRVRTADELTGLLEGAKSIRDRHPVWVLEPFLQGREFTVCLVQTPGGSPVALPLSEIELTETEAIFDYRTKYLPTTEVRTWTPSRWDAETVAGIRQQVAEAFQVLGLRDWARIDGWVLDDGRCVLTDINLVSGLEQNSFAFQQAAVAGYSHAQFLRLLLSSHLDRRGKALPHALEQSPERQPVDILFGGGTSERQVSLMSGSNVWLKLRGSERYDPTPWLLAPDGLMVWQLPYAFALRHTVEDVLVDCQRFLDTPEPFQVARDQVGAGLQAGGAAVAPDLESEPPLGISWMDFLARRAPVFLALHGGKGEDGTVQRELVASGRIHTGPGVEACEVCSHKGETSRAINAAKVPGLGTLGKVGMGDLVEQAPSGDESRRLWKHLVTSLRSKDLIVKPMSDGCSSGIQRVRSAREIHRYLDYLYRSERIPANTFRGQATPIEMPAQLPDSILFETYQTTDRVWIDRRGRLRVRWKLDRLTYTFGWVEVTCGVIEGEDGQLRALTPSLTVASADVLSLEEKFQGGTGVNLTPPPPEIVRPEALEQGRQRIQKAAEVLGITGFARLDAFLHRRSGKVILIEANTTPGLTPATVLYHQGLTEDPPMPPRALLEHFLTTAQRRVANAS